MKPINTLRFKKAIFLSKGKRQGKKRPILYKSDPNRDDKSKRLKRPSDLEGKKIHSLSQLSYK